MCVSVCVRVKTLSDQMRVTSPTGVHFQEMGIFSITVYLLLYIKFTLPVVSECGI